jgi:hypothetical protein
VVKWIRSITRPSKPIRAEGPEPREAARRGLGCRGRAAELSNRETALQNDAGEPTFTALVRRLSAAGDGLDAATFDRSWAALRRALAAELRRRGLWEGRPSHLGIYGAERWPQGPDATGSDPLDELTAECYIFIFVDRLRALRAQLEIKETVEGLVVVNVRHFLYQRQKDNDPLGFQVFDAMRTAVRRALETGALEVLEGDPRIRNETVLGFRVGAEAAGPGDVDLAALVREWNDELLPDLVTARGRGRAPVLGGLQRRIEELRERGIEAIRFKDLIDPLKDDVRARWADLVEQEVREVGSDDDERWPADPSRLLRPDLRLEARDAFRALVACVSERVAGFGEGAAARRHLDTLWGFLRTWAAGRVGEEALPSRRKLAALLGIPRDRLPALYAVLQRLVEGCERETVGSGFGPGTRAEAPPATERRPR